MTIYVCPPEAIFQRPTDGNKPFHPTWKKVFSRYSSTFEASVWINPMLGIHPPSPVIHPWDSGNTTLLMLPLPKLAYRFVS
jgi:hypothetical protein